MNEPPPGSNAQPLQPDEVLSAVSAHDADIALRARASVAPNSGSGSRGLCAPAGGKGFGAATDEVASRFVSAFIRADKPASKEA